MNYQYVVHVNLTIVRYNFESNCEQILMAKATHPDATDNEIMVV